MSCKFQVIRIDNLMVRKIDLQVGENIIGNDIDTGVDVTVKEAVKINVSSDGDMSITPYEGISCYIKSYGSSHWKLLRTNFTLPLKVKDTCLLLPIKIWFRVLSVMDAINEDRCGKRKVEELIENELPDKRCRSEADVEIEPSNYILNNNCDAPYLVQVDCTGGDIVENECINDANDQDLVHSNLAQCSPIDDNEEGQELESYSAPCSMKQSNEEVNLLLNTNTSEHDDENIKNVGEQNNCINGDTAPTEEDLITTNNDTDNNTNQTPTTNAQSIREKCRYGSECYRQNAEHKAKFSHPGDADYNLPDNRPECPYGLNCYRKNPQHKLDYKHTRNKRRTTRTPARSPEDFSDLEDSMDESVDESDYDPSFIDDESLEEFESDFEDDV